MEGVVEDPAWGSKMRFVALRRTDVESHHRLFASKLGGIPIVQLVSEHGVLKAFDRDVVIVSASRFLS